MTTIFRLTLLAMLIALAGYTGLVIAEYGPDFYHPFFGAIGAVDWQGQFNADFLTLLALLALWTAWRNAFSPAGLGLAIVAFLLGAGFLTVYLLYLSWRERGDVARMLVGNRMEGRG